MSFHSFDALNEPGWNPLSSDISEERRQKNGSDLKKALSLIALLQELPRGYRPLLDEFQLFNFNPLTQQVTQKELKELHHVISEMCVIFDKPSNRIFYCSEKLDALELEVIQAYLKELIGQNLEWNTVDEGTWEDLCDEFSQHTLLLELQDNGTVTLSQSSSVELDTEAEASEKS
ncbi:MAG: hypothetical protein JWO53_147, partial [Chlamydiia bacterium]|nr:hypothetical protein [Chlamydiia bacterium]